MVLGMVQTNTWFVINEKTKELILIDPADDAGRIIRKIEADGLKLQGILLTHGHFDHIGAVDDLRAYFKGVQCYAGEKEEEVLENGSYNLSASWAVACAVCPSCHKNSRLLKKGLVVFSQRTTLHHWLYSFGRPRQEWITRA